LFDIEDNIGRRPLSREAISSYILSESNKTEQFKAFKK